MTLVFALALAGLALELPPELRGRDRRSTSQVALKSTGTALHEKPKIRVSNAAQQFLLSYADGPIQIVFCTFTAFFKTPVKVSGYIDPEWNELPQFTTRQVINELSPTMNRTGFTMRLCSFFGCTGTDGGALNIVIDCRIYSCTFTRCTATGAGGAVWFSAPMTNTTWRLLINSCTFSESSAVTFGGSVYAYNGVFQVFRTEFLRSTAGVGGAFYFDQGQSFGVLYVLSCMFYDCAATGSVDGQMFYAAMNVRGTAEIHLDFNRFTKPLPENYTELNQQDFPGDTFWELANGVGVVTLFRNRFGTAIEAVQQTPTYTFSPTPSQSPWPTATPTPPPTPTPTPTPTLEFTDSAPFTESMTFAPSNTFTPTPISLTIPTIVPTPSMSPAQTPPASTPPPTPSVSPSPTISPTASASPTPSQSPMASATASISQSPPISWASLSLGLLIFGCLLLLAGIIANIIMCAVCCRPQEVLAKQYV